MLSVLQGMAVQGGELMPRRYYQDEAKAREEYKTMQANPDLSVTEPVLDSFHQKWAVEWRLKGTLQIPPALDEDRA